MTYRVMELDKYENAVFYRVACDCTCNDCDLTIELEDDKDFNQIMLNMFKNLVWSSYWGDRNWFQRLHRRISGALKILFIGRIKVEETFIFQGREHIASFLKAMEEGMNKMEKEEKNDL